MQESVCAPNEKFRKRPYMPPRVIAYGSVAKLTQGGGSVVIADGQSGMGMA